MPVRVTYPNTVSYNGTVTLSASFTDTDGTSVDPTSLNFSYQPQATGVINVLTYGTDTAFVKDSVGHYHVDLTGNVAGLWLFEFTGHGTNAAARSDYFYVTPNPFTPIPVTPASQTGLARFFVVPSGSTDGTNTVFTLSEVPLPNTLWVFVDSVIRFDFNLFGATITFTGTPPQTGETVRVCYYI